MVGCHPPFANSAKDGAPSKTSFRYFSRSPKVRPAQPTNTQLSELKLRPPKTSTSKSGDKERFLHFVAAAPQERGEKQNLAATTVGMTAFLDGRELGEARATAATD